VDPTSDPDVLAGEGQKVTRADLLAVISRHHTNLAITGTHGKTTASSMLVHIALAARWHPSWLIGADIRGAGNNGHFDGDTLIMELDESYGSFRETVPQGLAILNIEADHLDHYGSLENLEAAFAEIATHTVGPVVYFSDSVAPRVVADAQTTHSVGFDETAKWQITEYHSSREGSSCLVRHRDSSVVLSISLRVPGRHNVINASVAAVLAHLYGATPSDIERGLAAFQGAPRRFEIRGRIDGATLVDDYAHLPSEVSATLAAARDTGADRVLAVFQPHRITRTTSLAEEFGPAFDRATDVIVTDIYDAGEPNPDGVTGELVARAIERHGVVPVTYVSALDALEDVIRHRATHYDMVVVMGAGDIATTVDRLAGDE
jgi:UDP-N-acetylmuramate--alanine ligase